MKKILLACTSLFLLLSGCQNPSNIQSSNPSEVMKTDPITAESNIYDFSFLNLYEQTQEYTEAVGKNNIFLSGIDTNNAINFIFTPNGDIKYMEIGCGVRKETENNNLIFEKFKISNELTKNPIDESIKFSPKIVSYGEDELPSYSIDSFSGLLETTQYLDRLNLQNIIENYHVGNPTAYFLKSGPLGAVSSNYINDMEKNIICLDCTDPDNVHQIDRITYSETSPYSGTFDDYASYYVILPFYESELTTEKINTLYYSNYDFDNVILLLKE